MQPPNRSRPHPHVNIPHNTRPPPSIPTPSNAYSPYAFELTQDNQSNGYLPNPYGHEFPTSPVPLAPDSAQLGVPGWTRPRAISSYEPQAATFAFPEPQLHRAVSQRDSLTPTASRAPPLHRSSRSDAGLSPPSHESGASSPRSSVASFYSYSSTSEPETTATDLPDISTISLDSEEGLRRFQAGDVPDKDEEWYRFVPPEAQEALGKHEVERQSVIFEIFKSEKDYVSDLQVVKEVFIEPLRSAQPEILPKDKLRGFISEVFWNIDKILSHHQRMLGGLFARQLDQHPLIQSVADIVLDNSLMMMSDYESYIKHSPIALERHRKELKANPDYERFVSRCAEDPRIRKRDLKTFLSRPITRLPRLRLLLERIEKITEPDHPDLETIPLALTILGDLIKSTEPGIESAEGKVKFWDVCESLVYAKGEIIDMDLYDDSRTLLHSSNLSRKTGSDTWHSWSELLVVLLDNYLLMLKEEGRSKGGYKRQVVSRPIPLEYLQLGSFNEPAETRRDPNESSGLLGSLSGSSRQALFPFTLYHAASRSTRQYTLYAATANVRKKWHDALIDAIAIRKVRQESNMWFAPQTIDDDFFRIISPRVPFNPTTKFPGRITSAAPFFSGGRSFIAVGCAAGIYVGLSGQSYRRVLSYTNPPAVAVLQRFGKFLVQHDGSLYSYSLDLLARASQQQTTQQALEGSAEKLAGHDGSVVFFKTGQLSDRTLVVFATKSFLQVTLYALEALKTLDAGLSAKRVSGPLSYRPYGNPLYIPRDASNAVFLAKSIGIATEKGILITNPTSPPNTSSTLVPDFAQASASMPVYSLKNRCDTAKVLGLERVDSSELLVVYDELGCFVGRQGWPMRSAAYIRWECKATAFVRRGGHILLFSPQFIEIRSIATGRLVQVIQGRDILLLHAGLSEKDTLLVSMKGDKDDKGGISQKIVELVQTSEIVTSSATSSASVGGVWDEWDMS